MSDEIIKILDDLGERFGLAIDWTSENVIPQLEVLYGKFVNYSIVMKSMSVGIGVIFIVTLIILLLGLYKSYYKCLNTKQDTIYFYWYETTYHYSTNVAEPRANDVPTTLCEIACGVLFIVAIPLLLCSLGDLIKLLTIPELYVFEYLKAYL